MPAPTTWKTLQDLLAIDTDECQIWPHAVTDRGYPTMTHPVTGERYAHRAVLYETVGPCPDGHEAAHSCGVRACVNKRHLRWATHSENNHERNDHGTMPKGSKHWATHMTEDDAREMIRLRKDEGWSMQRLADRYGIHRASVGRIVNGRSWIWLTTEA